MLLNVAELEPTFHSRKHILVDLNQEFIIWSETKVLKVGMGFWHLHEV